ncbi:FtsX-like permease family protein [Fulvivirga sp.]|uniref:ABC transporter permease n=1 Tax=Fulvivirga sp. TaxID=1931237 RepID=UPI0032EB2E3A
MLISYFKIAIRNLLKQKLFSVINILSLAVGLTCSLLLFLFVHDELSFDKFNSKGDSIYRVVQHTNLPDGSLQWQGIFHAIGMGPALKEEIPEVKEFVRFYKPFGDGKYYVKQHETSFYDEVLYADLSVFDIFDFPLLKGSINASNINSVVISEKASIKYFGDADPINKPLAVRIDDQYVEFNVVAVVKNIPSNSSIKFDVLLPIDHIVEVGQFKRWKDEWGFGAIITYVLLNDGTSATALTSKLESLLGKYYPYNAEVAKERGYKSATDYRFLQLEPLVDVHFNTEVLEGIVPSSNPMYSYILLGLVIGVLGVACFNFMNLSLARSTHRVKEVGLRKTIGAVRSQLIKQFLGESIFISFIALLIAVLSADLLLPVFNYLTGKQLVIGALFNPASILALLSICLFIGVMAGFYPAFVISKFNIKETLAGVKHKGAGSFTKMLIVIQFAIATVLVIGMIVIQKQTDYLQNKDLGFDSRQVISLKNAKIGETSIYSHLKTSLATHSGIYSIAAANQTFADPSGLGGRGFTYKGEQKRVGMIAVTEDYIKTLGLKLSSGNEFDGQAAKNEVIINAACAKDFELQIADKIEGFTRNPEDDPQVVGIMEDFNYSSLKTEIFPMLISFTDSDDLGHIFIKLSGVNKEDALSYIEQQWNVVAPDLPFDYSFLNDTMEAQYESEEKWASIISYSMLMTIILSCLGLFGIVALGLEARKKEISIRKVFGAHVSNIVWLVSNSYLKLIILAYCIAAPVSYYLVDQWLSNFEYKIQVNPLVYAIGGAVIISISLATIGIRTVKSALNNPVDNLRND